MHYFKNLSVIIKNSANGLFFCLELFSTITHVRRHAKKLLEWSEHISVVEKCFEKGNVS